MRALGVLAALLLCGGAQCATTDGTLITNVATATYGSPDGMGYAVTWGETEWVIVVNPQLALRKYSSPTMQCSGGTVTFCIYAVNTSNLSSTFNVMVGDRMPGSGTGDGFAYIVGGGSTWSGTAGAVVTPGYAYCPSMCPPAFYQPVAGEPTNGQAGPYYIRWAIDVIGPGKSTLVCFQARVL